MRSAISVENIDMILILKILGALGGGSGSFDYRTASGARTLASKWAESIVRSFIEGQKGTAGLPSVPFHIEDAIQDGLPV